MNRSIKLNDKLWPLNFEAATFYTACIEYGNCSLQELIQEMVANKPRALFTLFKCAIEEGIRTAHGSYPLPENFSWKDVANWVGFDQEKLLEMVELAVSTIKSELTEDESEDQDEGSDEKKDAASPSKD